VTQSQSIDRYRVTLKRLVLTINGRIFIADKMINTG